MIDIDGLERLAAQATPGPWFVTCNCTGKTFYTIKINRVYIGETLGVYNGEANAAYIAAACNAVPELIKMYREADDEAADANSAWQKVRRENLALREQVRELEKALIELVKIEVSLPECAVCWERDRCTDRSHGDNCLAVGYIVDMAKEAAKEAGK